jgi:alpha-beta hydrolase superfamily lysophospholipase
MMSDTFRFKTDDGAEIFVRKWLPEETEPPKAVVQIAHGMAEHSKRYERFAGALVDAGYAVYANDHRGHGETAGSLDNIGYFADENGWSLVAGDMLSLTRIIKKEHPDVPVFLFGHSMGSLLSRSYILSHADEIKGVIISGTGGDPGLLGTIGMLITKLEIWRKGKKYRSPILTKMSFGDFNKPFRPNRTEFDWLSRDEAEVDKYVDDPYCGGMFTAGFFLDMLTGLAEVNNAQRIRNVPSDLPIYIFSGDKDPVANDTKGVRQVYEAFKTAGVNDVVLKFYEGGRHEMLNETNREEVHQDIIEWLDKHC